ncbi:MAG: tetratricopeptide repeat protein, partial [Candidatus Thorarchaeota archaeon]|nr:tetratricopeptide repeat protein [Candidatus Thorarchaeota archaeon]
KRLEEAILSFHRSLQINPLDPEAWLNIGKLFVDLEKFDEAEGPLKTALMKLKKHPGALYYLGKVYVAKGKNKQAKKALKEARKNAKMFPEEAAQLTAQIDEILRGL